MTKFIVTFHLGLILLFGFSNIGMAQKPSRSSEGLLVLYDFSQSEGVWIEDHSGLEPPLNLKISDEKGVKRYAGSLEIVAETQIFTESDTRRLVEVIQRSGTMTLEAWIRPSKLEQLGPARIVTFSGNSSQRNFTLGQDGANYDVRYRTTETGRNGTPSLASSKYRLTDTLTHVVYSRNRSGRASLYINGQLNATTQVTGSLSNWAPMKLGLGNELGGQRPWLGELYLVALYDRELRAQEVANHFDLGPEASTESGRNAEELARIAMFETRIAPMLSKHCLECHDTATAEAGLDLSRKTSAFQGGNSGLGLVTGNASASLIWQQVANGDMPHDRAPLTETETSLLGQWIDEGVVWTLNRIDPANYRNVQELRDKWIRRLTREEYIATVLATTGVSIRDEAEQLLPAELRADGFSNTSYNLGIDLKHIDAYAQLAQRVVERMNVREFAQRFSNRLRLTDNDMKTLIAQMGKWMLRGPLDDREITVYQGITTTVASAGGGFDEAVALVIEAMLQSPRFIYRMENQIGPDRLLPVTDYELASRMSYIVWGSSPDQELMALAEKGRLADAEIQNQQIRRMLEDPRAREQSLRFLSDWLDLDRLVDLKPSPDRFPNWNEMLAEEMRKETLAFFEEVVWKQDLPLSNLMNAQFSFLSPALAKHYGIAPDRIRAQEASEKYDLRDNPYRGGLLTQGSLLTVGGDDASMVTRGLLVMHELLRGVVNDPPPCVDTTPVPTEPGVTQRTLAMNRIQNTQCGGCHRRFEPLAFGLEPFDGLGRFQHEDEHGNSLQEDGEILFPGDAQATPFQTTSELMDLLAKSPRVKKSLTWKLTQFAVGRPLTASDVSHVDSIHSAAEKAGGRYTDVLTEILRSDLVQKILTHRRTRVP